MDFWKRTSVEHVCSDVLVRSATEFRHALDLLHQDGSLMNNPYADEIMKGLCITEEELGRRGVNLPGGRKEGKPQPPALSHYIGGVA